MSHTATISPTLIDSTARGLDEQLRPALDALADLDAKDDSRIGLRNDIIEHAIPLADRLARRFDRRGIPLEDLTQVARLALVKAVDGFSSRRGSAFSRFAVPTILGELKRHFRDKGWIVRVPRRLQETRLAINEANPVLHQKLGRTPTVEDYAGYLGMGAEQVRAGMACVHAYDAISLQSPAHAGSEDELAELIGDVDPELDVAETRTTLRPLIAKLPERERQILALRFAEDMTQAQIAERIELSQMHVSRLLRQSLTQLRASLDRRPVRRHGMKSMANR